MLALRSLCIVIIFLRFADTRLTDFTISKIFQGFRQAGFQLLYVRVNADLIFKLHRR